MKYKIYHIATNISNPNISYLYYCLDYNEYISKYDINSLKTKIIEDIILLQPYYIFIDNNDMIDNNDIEKIKYYSNCKIKIVFLTDGNISINNFANIFFIKTDKPDICKLKEIIKIIERNKINLFMSFYNEKNEQRKNEHLKCLKNNANNNLIDNIYLISEDELIDENIYKNKKIQTVKVNLLPTYS
jgi:hypothetical protein